MDFILISQEMLDKLEIGYFAIADACDIPNATMREILADGSQAFTKANDLLTTRQLDRLVEVSALIREAYDWARGQDVMGNPKSAAEDSDGYIVELMNLLECTAQLPVNAVSAVSGIPIEKLMAAKQEITTAGKITSLTDEEKRGLMLILFRFYYALDREYNFRKLLLPQNMSYEKPLSASIAANIGKQSMGLFFDTRFPSDPETVHL